MKCVVTTRKEVLESLKKQGYYLIGVDGTVPGAQNLYDELYDHHRTGGADIQLDEMDGYHGLDSDSLGGNFSDIAVVTTSVDADAIVAAYRLTYEYTQLNQGQDLLRSIAYDCDHLAVPESLSEYADKAAQVVAALKEEANLLAKKLNMPDDRRQWTIEDKEKFGSLAFEQGVNLIFELLSGEWDYRLPANKYWQEVEKITQQIKKENRIRKYRNHLIFDGRGISGYIDPRCFYRNLTSEDSEKVNPIAVFVFDHSLGGQKYTIGVIPLHKDRCCVDLTKTVFSALNEAEKQINPESQDWGGRATVGGSPFNNPSLLTPEQVIDMIQVSW
jgi:hypothetical protein